MPISTIPMSSAIRIALLSLLCAVVLVGCATTEKRFKKGTELEANGRLVEASEYYLRVLNDDPDYTEARDRLNDIGPQIVADYMLNASNRTAAGQYVAAYDQYVVIETFLRQTSNVGVIIPRPDTLDELKLAADSRAYDQLLTRAAGAAADGDFARAIESYGRARAWHSISEEQLQAIDQEIARVEYMWSRRLFDDGQFRAAFEHTTNALALIPPNGDLHRELVALQERAVADGSVIVAFLPIGQTDDVMRAAPDVLTDDLNDVLLFEYWSMPPVFVLTADPIVVRREMRRITGRAARVVSRNDAIDIGRALDADYVVAGEMNRYQDEEQRVRERTYEVQTRGRNPIDTSYVVKRYTIDRRARVAYRIYDVRRRSSVEQGSADARSELAVERGVYPGNYNDLDLDGNQLALFDPNEIARQNQTLDEALADELAGKLAKEIIDEIMKRIP